MAKQYDSKSSLRKRMLNGANKLANNVGSTMGPRGRNVILQQKGKGPIITKDGVTVSRFVDSDDLMENAGIMILKQAAEETNTSAGDGTSTCTVLASAMFSTAYKHIELGVSPVEIKKGMDIACKQVVEKLKSIATPVTSIEDIRHIATISANGDKIIGDLIAEAIDMIGKDGSVTVQDARAIETTLDVVEGFRMNGGYVSPRFMTDEVRRIMRYEKPLIMVTDERITTVEEMMPTLKLSAREGRPLVIVADEVEGEALASLIFNTVKGTMKVAALKAPDYGERRRGILSDLALSVGATVISKENGINLQDIKLEHFGEADTVEASRVNSVIVGGKGSLDKIEERATGLKEEIKEIKDIQEAEFLQERVTRLSSGVAVIKVGALTEAEMGEKKHRVEDALEAVKSAQEEGMVPGGGTALLKASVNLNMKVENSAQMIGANVVLESLSSPLRHIVENAGDSFEVVFQAMERFVTSEIENTVGYNASTGGYEDLIKAGVIDPVKVTRCALQNATSAAGILLTTEYGIVEE